MTRNPVFFSSGSGARVGSIPIARSKSCPSRGAPCEGEPLGPEFAPESEVYGPQRRRTREAREVRSRRGAAEVFRQAIEYILAEKIESVPSILFAATPAPISTGVKEDDRNISPRWLNICPR